MQTVAKAVLIGLVVFAVTPGLAETTPDPTPDFRPITQIKIAQPPVDPCTGACAKAATAERNAAGKTPDTVSAYRPSSSQARAARTMIAQGLAKRLKVSFSAAEKAVQGRDELISEWNDLRPQGDFKADDAADVLAKYWIFSWVFGGGVNPDSVTPAFHAGVKAQAHRIFETDPVLSKLSENQRQAFAENLMRLHDVSMWQLFDASKDPNKLKPVMDTIAAQFQQQFGISIFDLTLTNQLGFVERQ